MRPRQLPFGLPEPPPGWPQKAPGISLCMIVKNEERFLERCLRSVAGVVDEINVVDTGSTDRTIEIAKALGARVTHEQWRDDFALARNASLAMATRRWILQLDADEELSAESVDALRQIKNAPAHLTAMLVRCKNLSDGKSASGTVSHLITRIFPNHPRIRFRGSIHEFPSVDGSATAISAVPSPIAIVHYGYLDSVIAARDKFARNTRMIEESVVREPEDSYNWYNLGMTAHVGGDQRRAAQALERMWELCCTHGLRIFAGSGLQMLSTIYTEHLGDAQRGLHFANECLKIAPHYANAHFAAGKAYAAMQDYDNARAMYQAAMGDAEHLHRQYVVDEDASGWKPACEIGGTYAAQGDFAAALEWYDKALALRADARAARASRAHALEQLGRIEEARAEYEAVYESARDEQSALALLNFLLRHDRPAAVDSIEKLHSSLGPQAALAALQAAVHVAVSQNDFPKALELARTGLEYARDDAALNYDAAIACANTGSKEEALSHLQRIDCGEAVYQRAQYLRAVLLRELGRLDDALEALDRVLEAAGPQVDALLLRASVLELAGRKPDAEESFKRAVPLESKRASIELAAFYLREGRPADAKRVAEQALSGTRRRGLVSIVMLSWNAPQFTKLALESIRAHTSGEYEIVIVDNGSAAETVEWLKSLPDVRVIFNAENRGYAAGNNQGLAAARGEYVVLLNNDVVVTDGWLDGLLDAFDRVPGLGISAPRSNKVAGNQQVTDAVYADMTQMHGYARARRERFRGQHYLTDRAIGLCLCIARRVIDDVGGIDEQYGTGNFEDDDFCLRVRAAGYQIAVCEDVFIHHFGSQTFAANKVDWASTMRENWHKFAKKWGYPEAYPEQGYAPAVAIAKGFDRTRHYVALPQLV
jgi:GT2 family glycosyltransferase/tetratricopeptide (TPR) repeat protein